MDQRDLSLVVAMVELFPFLEASDSDNQIWKTMDCHSHDNDHRSTYQASPALVGGQATS
jgi:hypothetical protein